MKLNVVILSSGLGSRLSPITDYIPKCLVNIGSKTALAHQIEYYNQHFDVENIYVIVHSKYKSMVKNYLIANDYEAIVISEDRTTGSGDAINEFVNSNEYLLGKPVIFNWCDVIPASKIELGNSKIIFTNGKSCGYVVSNDGNIPKKVKGDGNVIGIYYIPGMIDIQHLYTSGDDFIKIFDIVAFEAKEIEKVIDFGDLKKFDNVCKNLTIEREFNKVDIDFRTVKKTAINPKGQKLQEDELEWYEHAPKDLVPRILEIDEDYFIMDRVIGDMIFQLETDKGYFIMDRIIGDMIFQSENGGHRFEIISKAIESIKELHNSKEVIPISKKVLERDIKFEAIDKLEHRCNVIDGIISGFGNITHVNGTEIRSHEEISNILYHKLLKCNEKVETYSFIHGDCNFSNTMIDTDDNIKYIDPRGYFGKSKLYGLPSYDLSKILYACSGYDEFNSDPDFSIINIEGGNISFKIKPWISNYMHLGIFPIECYYWLALIWINLGGYFKNNPIKATAAYYHGLYLAEKVLAIPQQKHRILKDGSKIEELDKGIDILIKTRCPKKWELIDNETGQHYVATGSPELMKMWQKI